MYGRRAAIAVALLLASFGFEGCSRISQAFSEPAGCDVAVADFERILALHRDEPIVVQSDTNRSLDSADRVLNKGWRKAKPSRALAEKFAKAPPGDVLNACPSVRRLLTERKVAFGSEAARAAASSEPPREISPISSHLYLSMSLPVVSDDGQEALVVTESAGGASIAYFRRDDGGHWRREDSAVAAIA
jgi:hypothetical protein